MRRLIAGVAIATALIAGAVAAFIWLRPDAAYAAAIALERWRGGLEARSVDAASYRWSYLDGGSGTPLLLLHGFAADKDNWTRISPYLTDSNRIIAPDLIGFGQSELPADAGYSIGEQADRVLAFATALGLDRFHLGGSSMGGYIAVAMAARAPARIDSLWLLAPGGVAGAQPSEMFQRIEAGSNPLIPPTPAAFSETLAFVFHETPFIPGPIRAHLAHTLAARRPLLEQIFSALRYQSRPLEDYLEGLSNPTLVLWGREDRVLHPSGARVIEARVPGAQIVELAETGHLPMIERPRETARIYLAWREAASAGSEGLSTSR